MYSIIQLQKKLIPDLLPLLERRYQILLYIRLMQPIGRRNLAVSLNITERVLRGEVTFLKEQNLIHVQATGMTLTHEGETLLTQLEDSMKEVSGASLLERTIKEAFSLSEVIVVSGDSDLSPWVKKEMGRASVACLKKYLAPEENIVAVTGGTTLASVAEMMTPHVKNHKITFVPARGGLGENVKNQANTICAKMAERSSQDYRLLHVPDQLSDDTYRSMIEEPLIQDMLHLIRSSNIILHGIGEAMTMAKRRQTSESDLNKIKNGHAVGEAFGYYFDQNGKIVHNVKTIGIQLDDLNHNKYVIAVAGGSTKAKAIKAFLNQARNSILITDEGAAKELARDLIF